jgi:hypothetical protein
LIGAASNYSELEGKAGGITMLFLIPSLVAFVTSRPNEHPFVTTTIGMIRMIAILPIPLGLIAGFVLITKGSQWILEAEAGIAAFFGLILLVGRLIDERKVRPDLNEYVEDNLTRIG